MLARLAQSFLANKVERVSYRNMATLEVTTSVKKLVRPKNGRMVAGVAAGMANYFGIDITIVRLIWILVALPGGAPGILLYIVCWVVIPEE